MYIPAKFKQDNIEELVALMQQYPFATLVTTTDEGIEATHFPTLLEQRGDDLVIKAHIAKANKLWQKVATGAEVLVIFNGPNSYISPNHYPTKKAHGKAVPTWNYVVVHAKGHIAYSHDPQWIYQLVDELSQAHESHSAMPWSISDAPAEYIDKMLPAIVGIKITISSIIGQWKLSQNQPEANQQGVISGLKTLDDQGASAVAAMVKKHCDK
uniref:FMN-binding negative transcriptional regulator n=1 Tax=Thaumasiovibrio occultus TaxID=1891184 RepID=UPI000B352470|nr:FMN-binding negative transcriptional regulator [Thaumasiovibrio occultus]